MLAGPLGVSLIRRENKHSKQEKAKDLQTDDGGGRNVR